MWSVDLIAVEHGRAFVWGEERTFRVTNGEINLSIEELRREESKEFSASWDGDESWASVALLDTKAALTATYD